MLQRTKLMLVVSVALSLSLVSMAAIAQDEEEAPPAPNDARVEADPDTSTPPPAPARAPTQRATVPPGARAEEVSTTSAPPAAESAARPASAEHQRPRSAAGEGRLRELASAATRATTPPPAPDGAMRELDEVLSAAPGDPLATMEPVRRPAPALERPSREETTLAIERVIPSVRACVEDGVGGVIMLRIVFLSNGRATTVEVQGQSAHLSPAVRGCITRAARQAQVSAFQRSRFTTTFPVRL